ncbi:MAG: DUF2339 domain-containing protein, partial [Stenotrophomonas sp.]|nr:DUF2339 domain-containing protein [Stenotrophomonas sp.]
MFFGLLVVVLVLAVPVLLVMALVSVSSLKRRVAALEASLAREGGDAEWRPAREQPLPAAEPFEPSAPGPDSVAAPLPEAAAPPLPPLPDVAAPPPARAIPAAAPPPAPRPPAQPNVIERGVARIKQWFTRGNVPVKVGMLVLLAGVAA